MSYVVDSTRLTGRGRPSRRRRGRSGGRLRALALGVAIGLIWPSVRARDWAGMMPADLGVIFPQGLRIGLPDGAGWSLPPGWPRVARKTDEAVPVTAAPARRSRGS